MTDTAARHRAAIVEALTSAFTERDFTALERWFAPEYVQHNPFIPGTRDGLRRYIASLPPDRRYEPGMAFAEGEFVVIHGRYSGGEGRKTFVAADIFRFENDRVVEHWDVLQEEVPAEQTVAGNAMFTIAESYRTEG